MFVRKNIFAFILLLLWGVVSNCTVTNNDIIQKQLFDLNWKFSQNNYKTANETRFIDGEWRSIDLPHDWSTDSLLSNFINNKEPETQSSETCWYRKSFEIPENWVGKKFLIEFEGISAQHEIFVNGVSVKSSENEQQLTQADLTHNLHPKEINLIAVRIDVTKEAGLEWKAETGIFGHVWLVIKENGRNP